MRMLASRKRIAVFSSILLLVALAIVFAWWRHAQTTKTSSVSPTCSAYGGTFDSLGPETNGKMVNDYSEFIATATLENPEVFDAQNNSKSVAPRIKISEVLKGEGSPHEGDTISVCSNMGHIDLPQVDHPRILLFLEGKDGDTWVPSLGYFGIIPEGKDGRFTISGFEGQKPVSIQELKQLIK